MKMCDSFRDLGSIEKVRSRDVFPKAHARKVLLTGEVKEFNDSSGDSLVCKFHEDCAATLWSTISSPYCLQPELLAGEFIQYYSDFPNIVLTLTNFRLMKFELQGFKQFHVVPICCIDVVEVRDLFNVHVFCKDFQTLRITFPTNESCSSWLKYLQSAAASPQKCEEIFAFAFAAWNKDDLSDVGGSSGWHKDHKQTKHSEEDNVSAEFQRLGFSSDVWRVSEKNKDFKLCPSYPRRLIVPEKVSDSDLEKAAFYRTFRRCPVVVWRHQTNGNVLVRSSQPEVGLFGWRNQSDEALLNSIVEACASLPSHQEDRSMNNVGGDGLVDALNRSGRIGSVRVCKKMIILDCRSYAAAWANRAKGGGFESSEYYQNTDIDFLALPNIHAIRKSFQQLRLVIANSSNVDAAPGWFQALDGSRWLQHLSALLSATTRVLEEIHLNCRPVLVHCSDGWDRTAQVVSLAKLCLDPYYRSIKGFKELCESEWLDFGHKFSDRCGLLCDDQNERAPVFLQWLDCVSQLHLQNPCSFEFSQAFLVKLAQHTYSGLFGTFLGNSAAEREKLRLNELTLSVWEYLFDSNLKRAQFCNGLYDSTAGCHSQEIRSSVKTFEGNIIWPHFMIQDLVLWKNVYMLSSIAYPRRVRANSNLADGDRTLTKTRSCDDIAQMANSVSAPAANAIHTATNGLQAIAHGVNADVLSSVVPSASNHCHFTRTVSVDSIPANLCALSQEKLNTISGEIMIGSSEVVARSSPTSNGATMLQARVDSCCPQDGLCKDNTCDSLQDVIGTNEACLCDTCNLPNWIPCNSRCALACPCRSSEKDCNCILANDHKHIADVIYTSRNGLDKHRHQHDSLEFGLDALGIANENNASLLESMSSTITSTSQNLFESLNGQVEGLEVRSAQQNHIATSTSDLIESARRGQSCCVNGGSSSRCLASRRAKPTDLLLPTSVRCERLEKTATGGDVMPSGHLLSNTKTTAAITVLDDFDGLAKVADPVQQRLHDIIVGNEQQLQRVIRSAQQSLKEALKHCHCSCPACNSHSDLNGRAIRHPSNSILFRDDKSDIDSGESRSLESTAASDLSWEAVEDSEARPTLWFPDYAINKCMGCDCLFHVITRKHHCRRCGKIFCGHCSNNQCPVPSEQHYSPVRVCNSCYDVLRQQESKLT